MPTTRSMRKESNDSSTTTSTTRTTESQNIKREGRKGRVKKINDLSPLLEADSKKSKKKKGKGLQYKRDLKSISEMLLHGIEKDSPVLFEKMKTVNAELERKRNDALENWRSNRNNMAKGIAQTPTAKKVAKIIKKKKRNINNNFDDDEESQSQADGKEKEISIGTPKGRVTRARAKKLVIIGPETSNNQKEESKQPESKQNTNEESVNKVTKSKAAAGLKRKANAVESPQTKEITEKLPENFDFGKRVRASKPANKKRILGEKSIELDVNSNTVEISIPNEINEEEDVPIVPNETLQKQSEDKKSNNNEKSKDIPSNTEKEEINGTFTKSVVEDELPSSTSSSKISSNQQEQILANKQKDEELLRRITKNEPSSSPHSIQQEQVMDNKQKDEELDNSKKEEINGTFTKTVCEDVLSSSSSSSKVSSNQQEQVLDNSVEVVEEIIPNGTNENDIPNEGQENQCISEEELFSDDDEELFSDEKDDDKSQTSSENNSNTDKNPVTITIKSDKRKLTEETFIKTKPVSTSKEELLSSSSSSLTSVNQQEQLLANKQKDEELLRRIKENEEKAARKKQEQLENKKAALKKKNEEWLQKTNKIQEEKLRQEKEKEKQIKEHEEKLKTIKQLNKPLLQAPLLPNKFVKPKVFLPKATPVTTKNLMKSPIHPPPPVLSFPMPALPSLPQNYANSNAATFIVSPPHSNASTTFVVSPKLLTKNKCVKNFNNESTFIVPASPVPSSSNTGANKKHNTNTNNNDVVHGLNTSSEEDSFYSLDTSTSGSTRANESCINYNITMYEEYNEEMTHRDNKKVPSWANSQQINKALFLQMPELRGNNLSIFPKSDRQRIYKKIPQHKKF